MYLGLQHFNETPAPQFVLNEEFVRKRNALAKTCCLKRKMCMPETLPVQYRSVHDTGLGEPLIPLLHGFLVEQFAPEKIIQAREMLVPGKVGGAGDRKTSRTRKLFRLEQARPRWRRRIYDRRIGLPGDKIWKGKRGLNADGAVPLALGKFRQARK